MTIQIYNTLTREKEPLETIEPGVVRMYVCGVTVYDSAHVGHAMSSLVFDVIRRYLEHRGYTVRYVQNFTDVDDKIIRRANRRGVSPFELADRYAREFLLEQARLNIEPADIYPRVSSEMPAIIDMVTELVESGHAYPAENGDVYFDVSRFPDYGKLSRRTFEGAESQGEASEHKDDPLDFALWKAAKPDEPWWDSPWGKGRPGWHIECSAMSSAHLGQQIDIHGGGSDLVFPHHENEIAQSEAACQCSPFARYWMHNGMVQMDDEKMSKSLGNIIRLHDFLDAHDPDVLRYYVLNSHYRHPTTFTDEAIAAAERGLDRLQGALRPPTGEEGEAEPEEIAALERAVGQADAAFHAAMDDDFGTPGALAALFELVTAINRARDAGVSGAPFADAQGQLEVLAGVLGLRLREGYEAERGDALEVAPVLEILVDLRERARANGDYALADEIRDRLAAVGVQLEDTAGGTTWRVTR